MEFEEFERRVLEKIEAVSGRKFAEEVKGTSVFEDFVELFFKKRVEPGKKLLKKLEKHWPIFKVAEEFYKTPHPSEAWRILKMWEEGVKNHELLRKYEEIGKTPDFFSIWADLAKERLGIEEDSPLSIIPYFWRYKEDVEKLIREAGKNFWEYKFEGKVPDVRGLKVVSYFGKTEEELRREILKAFWRDKGLRPPYLKKWRRILWEKTKYPEKLKSMMELLRGIHEKVGFAEKILSLSSNTGVLKAVGLKNTAETLRKIGNLIGRKYELAIAKTPEEVLLAHSSVRSCMHPSGEYPFGALAIAGGPVITLVARKDGKIVGRMNLIGHEKEGEIVFVPNDPEGVHGRVFRPLLKELRKRGIKIVENPNLELAKSKFHIKKFWHDKREGLVEFRM